MRESVDALIVIILHSTLHRVVAPPANDAPMTPARQSIAFFCNPNGGANITCLPTCVKPGEKPKYAPVETEEYIVGRSALSLIRVKRSC